MDIEGNSIDGVVCTRKRSRRNSFKDSVGWYSLLGWIRLNETKARLSYVFYFIRLFSATEVT